jgi:hypothetical protein
MPEPSKNQLLAAALLTLLLVILIAAFAWRIS